MILASEFIKNLHAATFASMLMKSGGLLYEAVRGLYMQAYPRPVETGGGGLGGATALLDFC